MRLEKAIIVFRKDWLEVRRNWQVLLPILILPLVVSIFLPIAMTGGFSAATSDNQTAKFANSTFIKSLPADAQRDAAGLTENQVTIYMILLYLIAPFFLIIPLMASSVIACDSFAGEKERKTTEALLATPLTDSELFLGKVLVAFLPAMAVTLFSFAIYSVVVNSIFLPIAGHIIMPNLSWVLLIFVLSPAIALAGVGITVLISSRVKGFREAQQISGMLVLPVLLLFFSQMSGVLFLGPPTIAILSVVLFAISYAVLRLGIRLFRREELLAKL